MKILEKVINLADFENKQIQNNVTEFADFLISTGKMLNPSNPYEWVADKMEDMSKWNKKDWESLYKRDMTFKEVRDAQITFENIAKKIREVANSYKDTIVENFEELKDGIYATQSAYDILNFFKNKPKPYRVVYDENNRYYFIGDALKYIHSDLITAAYNNGFYYEELESNSRNEIMIYIGNGLELGEILMFSFYPNDYVKNNDTDEERSSDWYNHKYVYDFGVIYTQEHCLLEDFDFYTLLGEPLEKEELALPENLEEKFEEIADDMFATNSAYDLINQMKNKPKPIRIVYDRDINYYFIGDAYSYIHQDILEEAFYQGFYPDMLSSSEARDKVDNYEVTLFAFYPSESHKQDIEKSSDGYTRKYVYEFGIIYAHEMTPLEDCELYSLLGEPIKKENIF